MQVLLYGGGIMTDRGSGSFPHPLSGVGPMLREEAEELVSQGSKRLSSSTLRTLPASITFAMNISSGPLFPHPHDRDQSILENG